MAEEDELVGFMAKYKIVKAPNGARDTSPG